MVSDTGRQATQRGNDIHIEVAVIVAGEGDFGPIRGKAGKAFGAGRRAEFISRAAVLGDNPEIASIGEDDVGIGYIRVTEKPGADLGR